MQHSTRGVRFGPFQSVRPLCAVHKCDRFIMLHEHQRTNHLLYRFDQISDTVARRRMFDRFLKTAHLDHPHILKIQSVGYDDTGRLCVITDYPGNQEGLVTLRDLLDRRGGRIEFAESIRLMVHLLEACGHAWEQGLTHGRFCMEELLVDRHGCTRVELFGLRQTLHNTLSEADARSEQTRSIVEIGYQLITGASYSGIDSSSESVKVSSFTKRHGKLWDTWFAMAMDPVNGFENAQQAIDTMPTDSEQIARLTELKPIATAQPKTTSTKKTGTVFSRFRRSSGSRIR